MLSLKYIRENTGYVQDSLTQKQSQVSISDLLKLDIQRRNYLKEVEENSVFYRYLKDLY